ncbi:rhodanese-like domain-containing protein 6 isoform X1 [Nicotiana tomentosiformis]|uniref:rhodanese-like domain-containing protein 6 isoform X1 n=1 Tax=Nicotiana tomentosiformis TaxID=4098 RepID=UPI00051BCA65|nr:rhodanese-like domain-containing protein 6 isoform X1 [Nicotiana tomentosiformis]
MANQEAKKQEEEEEEYGVLLYYKYTTIPDLQQLFNFYESICNTLSLLGRVRLSPNGVNVTVGGKLSALEEHIAAVKLNSLFDGTDFKLASCHEPSNDRVAKECGFTSLSIRIVKELVTLSSCPLQKSPEISNAGKHLSAVEFHSVLHNIGNSQDKLIPSSNNGIVLMDARNLYETRIGKFYTPNVETLDPEIRQYSDLPSWIDNNSEKLRGNNILMYCTGGIRCEMASAYIKSKGAGFEKVFQLYGGIQRYLEQFPDGGFFRGKNFVFDHRVSVGSSDSRILGTCLLCNSPFDDYSSRSRCTYCRMLVLVCDNCREKDSSYVCELCRKNSQCIQLTSATDFDNSVEISEVAELEAVSTSDRVAVPALVSGPKTLRKLRILCLHGFRQNASGFKGRTASLAKKLKSIAELVFVDAPHELPFIYQIRQNCDSASELENNHPLSESCNKKFSWLVAPDHKGENDSDWKIADSPFDPLQYQKQTEGFDKSIAYLKALYSKAGPFDGILGFSQGAAMAALVCLHQQKLIGEMEFRFAILCSGFAVNMNNCQQGSINVPSLHIFGSDKGKDRQIANEASRHLASVFENGCSVVIEHDFGHIIPTRPPYIDQIKDFLKRFL